MSRFNVSLETQMLIDAIRKASKENRIEISYEALNSACGRNVQSEASHCLRTARDTILREDNEVWEVDRMVGIRRLKGYEITAVGAQTLKSIRRKSRKGVRKLAATNFESLSNEEKIRHNSTAAMLGAMTHLSTTKSVARIDAVQTTQPRRVDFSETMKLFGS